MDRQQVESALAHGRRVFDWACLERLDLRGLDFSGVRGAQVKLGATDLTGAILTGVALRKVEAPGTNFSGARFDRAGAIKGRFRRAIFVGADLTEADLTGADLTEADLTGANLTGANLTGATLMGAVLVDACLVNATLVGCAIAAARLDGADLTGARIDWDDDAIASVASWTGATVPDGTPYTDGWRSTPLADGVANAGAANIGAAPDDGDDSPPPPDDAPERPNRFLMANPLFEVTEALPKPVLPPRSPVALFKRLPPPLLAAQFCGYVLWGATFAQLPGAMMGNVAIAGAAVLGAAGGAAVVPYVPLFGVLVFVLMALESVAQTLITRSRGFYSWP